MLLLYGYFLLLLFFVQFWLAHRITTLSRKFNDIQQPNKQMRYELRNKFINMFSLFFFDFIQNLTLNSNWLALVVYAVCSCVFQNAAKQRKRERKTSAIKNLYFSPISCSIACRARVCVCVRSSFTSFLKNLLPFLYFFLSV